jgi:hypothetical protein
MLVRCLFRRSRAGREASLAEITRWCLQTKTLPITQLDCTPQCNRTHRLGPRHLSGLSTRAAFHPGNGGPDHGLGDHYSGGSAGNYILDKSAIAGAACAFGNDSPAGDGEGGDEARLRWDRVFPELASAWEMIDTFSFASFSLGLSFLEHDRCAIEKSQLNRGHTDRINQEDTQSIPGTLKLLKGICQRSGFTDTVYRIEMAEGVIEYALVLNEIEIQLGLVRETFSREARKHRFARIVPKKAEMLLSVAEAWSSIWSKFPSTESPSRAAIEAYAVGLNEASVYHMMMVLQLGLQTLARQLRVKHDQQEWGRIIGHIEEAIRRKSETRGNTLKGSKPPTPRAAARSRIDATLFATAATEFVWFKDAWRNHIAHGRAQYDENDALKVITHVRGFMERLSTRLKERRR